MDKPKANEIDKYNGKETYVKPISEIVNLELEQPILSGSAPDFDNGGTWGFRP